MSCNNGRFSHIYVEKRIMSHFRTIEILAHFPKAEIVEIDHYKDIFNRKHQKYGIQHDSQSLILAQSEGSNIYVGARVCQSFDNEYFYYTSNVMNCLFDCEYCYLKGMYPSGNMVIFVNIEDTFRELEAILKEHSAYVCVSYDTDLMAIENIAGFVKLWTDFTINHPRLKIEIRTKSARTDLYDGLQPCERVIFAYTMSPDRIAGAYEHGAGSMKARVEAACVALDKKFTVRFCFDPMIYCHGWKLEYGNMLDTIIEKVDLTELLDVSVGSFRISQEYMKQMRKNAADSAVVQFPFDNISGVYQYPEAIRQEMEGFIIQRLSNYVERDRIFTWD